MPRKLIRVSTLILGLGSFLLLTVGCSALDTPKATISSPSTSSADADVPLKLKTVWAGTYAEDIQPTLNRYCVDCHGSNRAENGLRLDSYQAVIAGTKFGSVVTPGSASTSSLVFVIDGTAASEIQMPHEARKLTRNRIANIRAWIDAGAQP